jgi:FMN phosphatase YigB (HAD superfamily)
LTRTSAAASAIQFRTFSGETTVKLTLLLDLDGTLLDNNVGAFLPAYTKALSEYSKAYVQPDLFVRTLLAATQKMVLNNLPDRTLKETFDDAFYPTLGLQEAEMRETFDRFYRDVFPTLKTITRPIPAAMKLVEDALERGYKVGIATTPLFPRTAILQRLEWAGITPQEQEIALIPSYENFSFAKPNPTFYTEFLAKMGWPDEPVVMVGNNLDEDIAPARKIGLKTYFVPEDSSHHQSQFKEMASPGGSLEDVLPWIDSLSEEELRPDFSSPEALLAIMRATPAALTSLAYELPEEAWTLCPMPGEWCLAEITCHLRDVDAEVNIPRMKKILEEANPFLPGMDTDSWVSERKYIAQDCTEALTDFAQNRIQLLSVLENLRPEEWRRQARHAIFGPTELMEMVNIIAGHDRLHINQIYQTIPRKAQ